MTMKIALAGNPNAGKSSLFNGLTGGHQHVGNYPGVTVEKRTGRLKLNNLTIELTDLPGTYSLSAFAEDELAARNFLVEERPDIIINVIDSMNLERNLQLTAELIELNIPLIIALNKFDIAQQMGIKIKTQRMQELLGAPVIPTTANKCYGKNRLLEAIEELIKSPAPHHPIITYGHEIDELIGEIESELKTSFLFSQKIIDDQNLFWYAVKIIEQDPEITQRIKSENIFLNIHNKIQIISQHFVHTQSPSIEDAISSYRIGFASSITKNCYHKPIAEKKTTTDRLDMFLTHRVLGPAFLLIVLWLLYQATFTLSSKPVQWLDNIFGHFNNLILTYLEPGILQSLLSSGIISGVGGVLSFTPLIIVMFAIIAFLEDSGYMARIAFLMDRLLRAFGMHGNSILAFIVAGGISGGCAVPGILATRTLHDPKERLATILTVPFMNCGAKLPVYALLIDTFFKNHQATMMFLITLLSWFFALIVAGILRHTLLKGDAFPFVMELPLYHLPTFNGLLIHTWERTWGYIRKASTFILMAAILMWAMMTFPQTSQTSHQEQIEYSFAGRIGKTLETITLPLNGFDWKMNVALLGGISAKEVIVSTLATAHAIRTNDQPQTLKQHLQHSNNWNPLVAFSFIIFVMLYMPCLSVIAIIRKETSSWKWAIFSIVYTTALALLISSVIYQIGSKLL